ncbi:MAG: hypothetical protein ACRCXT_05255 [Paraclostridium sp.]
MDIMTQFEGPVSEEDIDLLISSVSNFELIIVVILFLFKIAVEVPTIEEFMYRRIAFIMGIIFGVLYYATKSIKLCIFDHFIDNILSGVAISLNSVSRIVCLAVGVILFVKAFKYLKSRTAEDLFYLS